MENILSLQVVEIQSDEQESSDNVPKADCSNKSWICSIGGTVATILTIAQL